MKVAPRSAVARVGSVYGEARLNYDGRAAKIAATNDKLKHESEIVFDDE